MIQNTEKILAREQRKVLRQARLQMIFRCFGKPLYQVQNILEGLGLKHNRIAKRLSRGKTLSATQYYKIS